MSTSTIKLAIVLAGVSAAISASIAPTVVAPTTLDSSIMLAVMGQGELDDQNFSVFKACVQNLNSTYRAYVDEGVLVLLPTANRTIDIKTTDMDLWQCIEASTSTVSLALESSEFDDEVQETSIDITAIDHANAVEMGVTGQIVTGHVPSRAPTSALDKRDAGYFYAYSSDENTCNGDFNYYHTQECYGVASAYSSTAAGNLDQSGPLTLSTHTIVSSCGNNKSKKLIVRDMGGRNLEVVQREEWSVYRPAQRSGCGMVQSYVEAYTSLQPYVYTVIA
ncbi:hypothetical protein GLAREA_02684 [Glarea lozoyensis ATCC 20868]|uniref:Uncharacterized protein n=1 Tax=Glarea lozoyensis (strain ATCC 20868 / MF5171) TaxID=1116229 RepID=S3CM62_GLAL2|nr:uncharacterized protein GLAREA_02684 [Glarea lozoyensis ATCC 20868]EPE26770.1 hypothetical protein GLAREA_02684 [Glarea lozoyensis ATCC 20868]